MKDWKDLDSNLFYAVNAVAEQLRPARPYWMSFAELQMRVLCYALDSGSGGHGNPKEDTGIEMEHVLKSLRIK